MKRKFNPYDGIPFRSALRPYQDGALAGIRPLEELCEGAGFGDGTAMLCGTFAAIGGVRPARSYRMEVSDPHLGKTMGLSYTVETLPIVA